MTEQAKEIRKIALKTINRAKTAHSGGVLSCIDILSVIYGRWLKLNDYANRDIFILSKAHASVALYSTLHYYGFLDKNTLKEYHVNGGKLPAHTDRFSHKYIEVSAGSLGHGMPIAVGMALSFKKRQNNRRVFTLIGDGEMQEGSIYEAALLAGKLKLNNLVVLLDNNRLQGYGRAEDIVFSEEVENMWKSFGFDVVRVNGHDEVAINEAIKSQTNKPLFVLCDTIKGYGVSFMEDELKYHYYKVGDEELKIALGDLDAR